MPKLAIAAQGGPGQDPRTAHLRPVIEFLLAHGNRPAYAWPEDGWHSDRGGELHYPLTASLDAAQLHEHFVFPASIQVQQDGSIRDSLNRVDIHHERSLPPLSFDLSPEPLSLAVDTPPRTDPHAPEDGQADERLRQILAARNARRDADPA